MDYSDRPTILRFANDTIDEPVGDLSLFLSFNVSCSQRQLVRNPTPYPKEMRAFANILRNYNHNHPRPSTQSPKVSISESLTRSIAFVFRNIRRRRRIC